MEINRMMSPMGERIMSFPIRSELISEYLKSRRIELGLTQFEVAKMLGYSSPQIISNWERCIANIPRKVFPKLIKIYRMDTGETKRLIFAEAQRHVDAALAYLFDKRKTPKS